MCFMLVPCNHAGDSKAHDVDRSLAVGAELQDAVLALIASAERVKTDQKEEAIKMTSCLDLKRDEIVNVIDAMKIVSKKIKSFLDGL